MSDTNEAEGVGAADPITGITGAKDDLAASAQLPDTGVEDGDAEEESDGGEAADVASGDHEAIQAESMETVTNDAVAGDTVYPGPGDGNDGPTGGAPGEVTPIQPENEVDPGSIDLDDER
ncbi:hypothetical protein [Amnibacterium endophyticum]|uniref:Sugar ABC transporter ATPase n=1 Tax=Amnibacterium endophyticum TaxID=2109337 RepID=A0ABW4LD86_9MICO